MPCQNNNPNFIIKREVSCFWTHQKLMSRGDIKICFVSFHVLITPTIFADQYYINRIFQMCYVVKLVNQIIICKSCFSKQNVSHKYCNIFLLHYRSSYSLRVWLKENNKNCMPALLPSQTTPVLPSRKASSNGFHLACVRKDKDRQQSKGEKCATKTSSD